MVFLEVRFSIISRRQTKSFLIQQFFKNVGEVQGEQPTFAKQIKLHNELQQKSKKKLEELQLPSKSEGCNKKQGFRGNCSSQGKLGMCPSLAEPDSGGISKNNILHKTMQK